MTARDSFPLSTYPMYASARADTADLAAAVGVTPDGSIQRLGLRVIGDSDDPLIVESLIRRAIANRTAPELCESIAQRVAPGTVSAVEVVTERHVLAGIARDASAIPVERIVHARCEP